MLLQYSVFNILGFSQKTLHFLGDDCMIAFFVFSIVLLVCTNDSSESRRIRY